MEPTMELYRGVTLHWYRVVRERGETSYATAWQWGGQWQHGPEHRDLEIACRVARRRIDRALAAATGDRRWTR